MNFSESALRLERSTDLHSSHVHQLSERLAKDLKAATTKSLCNLQNLWQNCDVSSSHEEKTDRTSRRRSIGLVKKCWIPVSSEYKSWNYFLESEKREHGNENSGAEDNEVNGLGTTAGYCRNDSYINQKPKILQKDASEKVGNMVCEPGTAMYCNSTNPPVQPGASLSTAPEASDAISTQTHVISQESDVDCKESACSSTHTDTSDDFVDRDEKIDVTFKPEISQLVLRNSFKNVVQIVSQFPDVVEVCDISRASTKEDTKPCIKPTSITSSLQASRGKIFPSPSVTVHELIGEQIRKACQIKKDPNEELSFQSEAKHPFNLSTHLSLRSFPGPFESVAVSHPLIFVDFRNVPTERRMRYEIARLATFNRLGTLAASAIRLAMSGFYYDEEIDEIKCFCCGKCKRDWNSSDIPSMVHLEISPNCKHANFKDETNVPIDERNYTLLKESTKPPATQSTTQQTQVNGQSSVSNFLTMGTFGLDPKARPGDRNESVPTSRKNQLDHSSSNADKRSATGVDSSLMSLSHFVVTDGQSPSELPSNSSKPGKGDWDFPYAEPRKSGDNGSKASQCIPQAPLQVTVYTTLAPRGPSGEKFHKRYPVQAQQPPAWTYRLPTTETGRSTEPRDSDQRQAIADPPTPGLDMEQAASPMNSKVIHRFMSFDKSWSTSMTGQNPKELAMAGFFCLGSGDSVRCFYCAITLREWKPGNDPWIVHVLARFSCAYVKAVKGDDFVLKTLIEHGRGLRQGPPAHGHLQLLSSSAFQGTESGSERRNSSESTSTEYGGQLQSTNRERRNADVNRVSRNTEPPSSAPSVVLANSSVSTAATNSGEVSSKMATSRDLREEVRPNGQFLQVDGEAANGSSSRPFMSTPASGTGAASPASVETAAGSQTALNRLTPVNPNIDAQLRQLVETNRQLRERRTCKLCHTNTVDTIFLPCGHICTCETCAKSIKSCIVCHKTIRGTAHVYLD